MFGYVYVFLWRFVIEKRFLHRRLIDLRLCFSPMGWPAQRFTVYSVQEQVRVCHPLSSCLALLLKKHLFELFNAPAAAGQVRAGRIPLWGQVQQQLGRRIFAVPDGDQGIMRARVRPATCVWGGEGRGGAHASCRQQQLENAQLTHPW